MTITRLDSVAQANRAVVEKAFAVLEAWDHRGESLGASELARRTGLPKSTSHRLLGILEAAGVVERLSGSYRLGDRLRGISGMVAAGFPDLREVGLPFMQDLYELTHETVHLGALDGADVHCVEKIYGHRRSPLASRVGGVLPAHTTALGKALLAFSSLNVQRSVLTYLDEPLVLSAELRRTRRAGVAFDLGETHPDVNCVAAPVLNREGRAIAAISVSGPAERFTPAMVTDRVRRAAHAASMALASGRPDSVSA
ncbi:IclR family transcriptional regulator [Lentzea tibetensis]|uniref:IclR family transcriptional regulator n=1 Tax=Lentzea tibetensis TaxID=2591470 RepID=A0A563ESA4_9PSEU|nr:IclR family transcriptional regulator [Lentzea tibetensis]TWP50615.1 IclR family transcriptional regulator [Lentzea tibetensis]